MPNLPDLDRDALQHLATLARLHLTSDRMPLLRARLQRLLEAFSALPAPSGGGTGDRGGPHLAGLDLGPSGLTPSLALRRDEPAPPLPPAAVLANAPQQAAGAFLVPRVVDA